MIMKFQSFLFLILASFIFVSCDDNETEFDDKPLSGTGSFVFDSYAPFSDRPITCFYHIPEGVSAEAPIMITLHGAGRDAINMRNYLVDQSDAEGFIVLAPEFSSASFPGSVAYNMANIFEDGDNPTDETLNPEDEWTFQVIDPLFDNFKNRIGNTSSRYDIFGHSAGAQLLHRFLTFRPDAKFNRVVCAAAGWYMMPDPTVDFPYGTKLSPAETYDMAPVFSRRTYVIVGENDTDPNSANLRHTPEADAQGFQRVERAQYYYSESRDLATDANITTNWSFNLVPNADHDGELNSQFAARILYP